MLRKILIDAIKSKVELIHEDVDKISMEETDLELLDKFDNALSSSMLALAKVIMDEKTVVS